MNQKKRKRTPKVTFNNKPGMKGSGTISVVSEYGNTGDMASTGLTSDDGNNATSPRIGGSYRDDEEELHAYLIKNKGEGGDGGHYRSDLDKFNYNMIKFGAMESLKNHIKDVIEELDEDAYGHATLTTQGQKALRGFGMQEDEELEFDDASQETSKFTSPLGEEKLTEQAQDPRINQNQQKIQDYQQKINDLSLDNQQIGIDMQKSAMQKAAGDASKGINAAANKKAQAASKIRQLKKFIKEIASELGQLGQIEITELTPEQIKKMDSLQAEQTRFIQQLEAAENELKAADQEESNLIKQNSQTIGGITKGIVDAEKALRQAKQQMKKQSSQQQQQQMAEIYFKKRKNSNLMEYMDSYKREILLEKAISKFFKFFDEGKTDEEVLRIYAEQGVVVPEPFVKKARDKHKKYKHEKLDLEELEQETKEFKRIPLNTEIEVEEKALSSRLFKEAKIKDRYEMPIEIKNALQNELQLNPLIRYVANLKAVNSIPPSYRIFLHNGQYFDIVYEDYSLMAKIETKEYYLDDKIGNNSVKYAIKHINRLLTQPTLKKGDMEDDEEGLESILGGGGGAPKGPSPTPPPKAPPPPPKPPPPPADEE